jgi:outer membrane protein OmpA-like peptidoglycan-associated protein
VKSASIAYWVTALVICGGGVACSFQASMSAGSGAKSPSEPASTEPAPTEPAPAEPAAEKPAARKANVKVSGAKVEVPGSSVVFEPDAATFAAGSPSEAALTELQAYLVQSPRVSRLRIEGHTHNLRPTEKSLELSGQRALTVKRWLTEHGVDPARLLAVGFGDTQPMVSNADAAGQAQNERIAFRIAQLDGKPYLGADPLAGGTEFR